MKQILGGAIDHHHHQLTNQSRSRGSPQSTRLRTETSSLLDAILYRSSSPRSNNNSRNGPNPPALGIYRRPRLQAGLWQTAVGLLSRAGKMIRLPTGHWGNVHTLLRR